MNFVVVSFQQPAFPLTEDVRALATRSMADMLQVAFDCYVRAAQSEEGGDEMWLQQYMLGKISEKRRDSPRVYLEHYKQVALHSHPFKHELKSDQNTKRSFFFVYVF